MHGQMDATKAQTEEAVDTPPPKNSLTLSWVGVRQQLLQPQLRPASAKNSAVGETVRGAQQKVQGETDPRRFCSLAHEAMVPPATGGGGWGLPGLQANTKPDFRAQRPMPGQL